MRRARASLILGKSTVRARIVDPVTARMRPEVEISVSDLVSPYKQSISISSVADWERWQSVLDEVAAETYSPVLVEEGSGGVRLEDVEIA